MGEHGKTWEILGYSALLGAIFISLTRIVTAFSSSEYMEKSMALYGMYGVWISIPLVISSYRLKKFFSIGLRNRKAEGGFQFGEFLLADERPHPMYYLGIGVSIALLLVLSFILYHKNIFDIYALLISIAITYSVYLFSKKKLFNNHYMKISIRIWSMMFAIWWSMSFINILRYRINEEYPLQFWEKLIGIPSTSFLIFSAILFIFGSIFWRIDTYIYKENRGPVSAVSIVFMGAGIASVFPPVWMIFSESVVYLTLFAFILSNLILTVIFASFLMRSNVRINVTTRRIMISSKFIGEEVREYPYDYLLSVGIRKGILGRYFDYGDLIFTVKKRDGRKTIVLHGIKNPLLIKNTILAMSSRNNGYEEYLRRPWVSGIENHKNSPLQTY